jgi:Arc/MetJ-type ribon-helix-helix transcriptional regulator
MYNPGMVQISQELEAEIRERAASGDYPTLDAFLRAALNALEQQKSLEALLLEGLESGIETLTDQDFEDIRASGLEQIRRLRNQ